MHIHINNNFITFQSNKSQANLSLINFRNTLYLGFFIFVFSSIFLFNAFSAGATFVSGPITTDTTWTIGGSPYVIQGSVAVVSGATLTIDPGVIIKFAYPHSELIVQGTLNANGADSQPIYFTSIKDDSVGGDTNNDGSATSPAPRDWKEIRIASNGTANFSYSTIRFGGYWNQGFFSQGNLSLDHCRLTQNYYQNLYIGSGTASIVSSEIDNSSYGIYQTGGTVSVSQSSVRDNGSYGIYNLSGGILSVTNTDFRNNQIPLLLSPQIDFTHSNNTAANNTYNGIGMTGIATTDRAWTKDLIPYIIFSEESATSSVWVSPNTTLTIDPGVIIKFAYPHSELIVQGTLNANGTNDQPIYFTSIKDDSVGGDTNNDGSATSPAPRDWKGIEIASTGAANFSHSTVRFGGYWSTGLLSQGALSLDHCRLTQNSYQNLVVQAGTVNIISSEIDHSDYGIYQTAGTVNMSQSSVRDNGSYGAYAAGSPTPMNTINNFWGDSTGPYHPTLNPGGLGNPVSDNVNFIPWLLTDPTKPKPPTLSNLKQLRSDQTTQINEGQTTTEDTVVFKAAIISPIGNQVKLEVELRQFTEPFTGIYDGGIISSNFLPSGSTAVITRYGLVKGQYKWRARVKDINGNASDWIEFGIPGNVDFEVYHFQINVAVILAEPSDVSHNSALTTASLCHLPELQNKTYPNGYDKGYYQDLVKCVKDYYKENSYGTLDLDFTVYDDSGNWFRMATSSRDYGNWYQLYRQESNVFNDYDFGGGEFVQNAILEASNTGVELSMYDMLAVVRSGVKLTEDNFNDGKWHPQNEALPRPPSPYEFIVSEYSLAGSWAHEAGHNLGTILSTGHRPLCDLYTAQVGDCGGAPLDSEMRIGGWDLMAEGSLLGSPTGRTPSHLSSFSKIKLNWLREELVGAGNYVIDSLETMKFGDLVKRFNVSNISYYLLEGRTPRPEFSEWDVSIPSEPKDALVLYKTRIEDIQGYPTPILNKIKVLNTDNDYYRNLLDWFRIDTKGAIIDIPNKNFKINTEIKRQGESRYIVGNLRPTNSSLKQIWSFTAPYTEPLPPVIIINRSLQLCNKIIPGDECMSCDPLSGWEISKDDRCPVGYREKPTGYPSYECRAFKVHRCCTEYHTGGDGDCDDVVINNNLKQCAFVDDITLCSGLPEGWEKPGKERPYSWVCPVAEGYRWTDNIICITNEGAAINNLNKEPVVPNPPVVPQLSKDIQKPVVPQLSKDIQKIDRDFFGQFWLLLLLIFILLVILFVLRLAFAFSPKQKRIIEFVAIALLSVLLLTIVALILSKSEKKERLLKPFAFKEISVMGEIVPGTGLINLDLDLHAYDGQGNHVGINYKTGEYENQIPGAVPSGDLGYDDEWIAVPEETRVYFMVSSKDVQRTLEVHPELQELTDGVETYEVQGIYYDEASQRYESNIATESIKPGIELEHQIVGTHDISIGQGALIAKVDFNPDNLNLKSRGKWITAYIELPIGYDVNEINLESIKLDGQISSVKPNEIGDYNNNGIPDLMVKFNRTAVQDILDVGDEVKIIISGELNDGRLFRGSDTIKVISNPQSAGNSKSPLFTTAMASILLIGGVLFLRLVIV